MKTKTPNPHEEFCRNTATHFVAVRGRTPATRTRVEFATLEDARAYGATFGDRRTMVYAVNGVGNSAHLENA